MREMATQAARAYRSHLQPACLACRRRKSRCHSESSGSCLMCQVHGTECIYPPNPRPSKDAARRKRQKPTEDIEPATKASRSTSKVIDGRPNLHSPEDQQNLHIVGPAGANDSQVLSDYLSRTRGTSSNSHNLVPVPASRSRSVFFTKVDRRPIGVNSSYNPAAEKLETIEKLLDPWCSVLIDVYFSNVNPCFPMIEEGGFRQQISQRKDSISPALMACLYAHTLVYWRYSELLRSQHCPDDRYIWNLAIGAIYSELHLQPSMSVIQAILLNVGGRPTTSLVGNGALLGAAVSLANSLGLNRNPLAWDISYSEKMQRMRIWWTLLFHDRWSSLTHGTPPRISRDHYDVPAPTIESLCNKRPKKIEEDVAEVFIALMGLTEVLDDFLQRIYRLHSSEASTPSALESSLNLWVESLNGSARCAVVQGVSLTVPGSANLRLSYLTTRLLSQRIALDATKQSPDADHHAVLACYFQSRQTAEEIVDATKQLGTEQLGDFWPSVSAFVYPATVSFLLRCALEACESAKGIIEDPFFKIARELLEAVRAHKESHSWDVADLCLTQHSEIMDKILSEAATNNHCAEQESDSWHDFLMSDTSFLDQFFPSFWDPPNQESID